MAITNLPTKLTSAGNQGDAGDYSTAASTVFQIDYSGLDYTPKTTDDYKNDFEEELQVFINGTRIYRLSTDTGIDDAGGLNTAQKSRLTNLNSSFGNEPWDIVTGTKKVQINQLHTAFGDSDGNSPGYPALNTWNIIKVIRIKPDKSTLATDFQSASVLTEAELDNAFSETFHMAQEAVDTATDALSLDTDNVWDAKSIRIKNVATPTADSDAVTKSYADGGAAGQSILANEDSIAKIGAGYDGTASTSGTNTNLVQINAVANDLVDINTVASADANITTIAARYDGTTDQTTGTNLNIANINTVATNIATISAKVSKSGDTMTGALTLSGAPTDTLHATTKTYVDTQDTTTQTNALSNSIVFSIALG